MGRVVAKVRSLYLDAVRVWSRGNTLDIDLWGNSMGDITLSEARRLHAWLGKWISEQEKENG